MTLHLKITFQNDQTKQIGTYSTEFNTESLKEAEKHFLNTKFYTEDDLTGKESAFTIIKVEEANAVN
jgi:hypothetical protein